MDASRIGRPLVLGLGLAACAQAHGSAASPARVAPAIPPPADAPAWTYDVVAGPGGRELSVQASFVPGTDTELSVQEGAEPFVRDVEVETAAGWKVAPSHDGSWFAPSCAAGCHVRYRFDLAAAASVHDDVRIARATPRLPSPSRPSPAAPQAFASSPGSWLLRPMREPAGEDPARPGTWFRFHVAVAPGDAFASGVFPVPGVAGTYEGRTGDRFDLPYAAFGVLRVHDVLGGKVQIAILPGALHDEDDVVAWAETCAKAVEAQYGAFPVQRLLVLMRPVSGGGVGFGTTMGIAGASIAIDVGEASTRADLATDWVLVHEMVHTALPDLLGPHHWLEEGLATYVEPIARARAGILPEADVWAEWVHGLPQGEPAPGDRGLDRTRTWGRTYWGGALFCMVADLEIRERTKDQKTLADALRAIDAASGGIAVGWPIDRVIAVGDAAVGVPVLREVYDRMKDAPSPVDLDAIWKRLGVVADGRDEGDVTFDDAAPLASIRKRWFRR